MPDQPQDQLLLNFPASPEYRFSNFIESPGSRFAFSTCKAMAEEIPVPYSSLYLAGDKGLGKTHLLIAIGNHVAETQPDKTALYLSCDDFIRTMESEDENTVHKTLLPLQEVDYCLMDDVDHIMGHPQAQEKLYLIYNTLKDRGGRMVFTGRTAPDKIPETEAYLKSRLQWGLAVELQPMDDTSSARVFQKLGHDLNLQIPEKVVAYLMTRIPRDYASIKHAVIRLNEESYKQKKKVTLPLAKTALNLP
jgi:chromosomal replication initiator protein